MATDSNTPGNSQENSPEAQKLQDLDAKWEGRLQKLTSLITNLERTVDAKLSIHESPGTSRENPEAPTKDGAKRKRTHSCSSVRRKLQALVYILPSTTAVFSYAIGSRKLSANEQFFVGIWRRVPESGARSEWVGVIL